MSFLNAASALGMARPPEETEYANLLTGEILGRHGSFQVDIPCHRMSSTAAATMEG